MRSTTVYYLFTFLYRFAMGATMTLYTPFLLDLGLSYAEIAVVNALFWVFLLVLEVPTGMLADGRGRGWSVMVGAGVFAAGHFWYAFANGFAHAVSAELVVAVGAAFMSGAMTAWIADAPGRTEPLHRVFGTATILSGVASIVSALVAVYLVEPFGRNAAFLLSGVFALLATAVAATCMRGRDPEHPMTEFEALRHAFAHLRRSSALRWAVIAQASYGMFQTFNMFWAPLMLTRMTQVEVGWLWGVMYASLAAAGWFVRRRFVGKDGSGVGIVLSLVVAGAPMAFFAPLPMTAVWIALLALHEFGRGAFGPFVDAFVHERVESGYRATFGSMQSFIGGVGMALTLGVMAIAMRPYDRDPQAILIMWVGTAVASVVIAALLWVFRPRSTTTS